MADTVGEAVVIIRTDARGLRRGVEKALNDAARGADDAGKRAGEDFVDEFGRSIGRRADQEDFGKSLGERFSESWKRTLGGMKSDWTTFKDAFDKERLDTRGGILGGADDEFRRTAVRMRGFLGEFQSFGRLIRTGSIDIRNWRAGLTAAGDTILGFGKSAYKAILLLGPVAGGLSSLAGIITAFGGAVQTGLIGGLAAIGPLAIAGGAAMLVLGQGIKAFGKHATEAQQKAVKPIKDQFVALQKVIQGNLFANVNQQAKLLIPTMNTLKTAMGGVSTAVSNTVTGFLQVIGPGGQANSAFTKLAGALGTLSQKLGQTVINLGSGLVGALGAAVPISTRFANDLVTLTSRFAKFANSAKGQTTLTDYFNRGYTAASKILTILGRLGTALFHVLDIGDKQTGESFLDSMLNSVTRFENYVTSAKGIQDMKRWFDDARYAAHSLALAFDALGTAFGALDTSSTRDQFRQMVDFATRLVTGFANLVPKVQAAAGPMSAVGNAAGGAWDAIKQLVTTIANLYNTVSEKVGTSVLETALNALGIAAGAANTILSALAPIINTLAGAFGKLPDPIKATAVALLLLQRTGITAAITGLGTKISAVGVAATGAAARATVMSRIGTFAGAATKLISPMGIAIAGVGLALGALSIHQRNAAKAAAEHKKNVDELTKSMQDQGDVTGSTVTKTTTQMLAEKGLYDIGKKLNISSKEVLAATQANNTARGGIAIKSQQAAEKLTEMRQALASGTGTMKDGTRVTNDMVTKQQDLVNSYAKLGSGMQEINKSLGDATAKWLAQAQAMDAMQQSTSAANPLIQDLTKQMQTFADSTQTATTRTDAFASALNELTDKSLSTQEAAIKQADAMRTLDQQFGTLKNSQGQVISQGENLRGAFIKGTDSLNVNSKAASDLVQTFKGSVVPAFADVVRAAFDAAGGVKNLGPATEAASKAAAGYDATLRKKLIGSFHLTAGQADALIKQFHLMPDDVTTLSRLIGGKATEAQLQDILDKAKDVGLTPVQLRANAEQAVKTAADLQKGIDAIKQHKVAGLTANNAPGRAKINELQGKIDAIRQKTATALAANPAAAKATIAALQRQLDSILQKHPTALKADKSPAHAEAVALLGEINAMKATVPVHADTAPATADVENWHPPDRIVKIFAQQGNAATRYATTGAMTGDIVNTPQFRMVGERGLREAIVPLDLPLNRVNPEVRQMSALLRGMGGSKTNSNGVTSTKVQNNTLNVYPQASDPQAVATSLLNRLTVMGR